MNARRYPPDQEMSLAERPIPSAEMGVDCSKAWFLPEGVEELLPVPARQLENLRRSITDLFDSWGYDLVVPPLIEHFEALVTGLGADLARHTFKLIDPQSGDLLGIRADMTPQVARIAAHRLRGRVPPLRLCYLGPVLRTVPSYVGGLRNPFQVGAELYGDPGIDSDLEIITLMIETLARIGFPPEQLHLSLGQVGVYRALIRQAALPEAAEAILFDILQRKALPELAPFLTKLDLSSELRAQFWALPQLYGGKEALAQAQELFVSASQEVHAALAALTAVAAQLSCNLHIDLADLRGYTYHTGVVFSAYAPGQGRALASGGRYDGMGQSRYATGFSLDLKAILPPAPIFPANAIYAPATVDPALDAKIQELRHTGLRVIRALPDQTAAPQDLGCSRVLIKVNCAWNIAPRIDIS